MTGSLKFKNDFERVAQRFEAWWQGEVLDRAVVSAGTPPQRPYQGPVSSHADHRQRWLDVEFAVEAGIARMQRTDYLADCLPIFWSNIGPEITATLFGCELEFSQNTSWSRPVVHDAAGWSSIAARAPNLENVYWQTMLKATRLAMEMNDGRYLVGITDLHGTYDIMAALRDPQMLCMDLLDCPELVDAAAKRVCEGYCQAQRQCLELTAQRGSTCWCNFFHGGPAFIPSCDFWCMVSGQIAREMIAPTIAAEMVDLRRSIFHLDGPQALRHLDVVLELPGLNAVQWIYGEGHGPAAKWIDVYKRIRAAGKSVQVVATDAADALTVLDALGPRGVWLLVYEAFKSADEVTVFLKDVERAGTK